jgi:hypothetical protein
MAEDPKKSETPTTPPAKEIKVPSDTDKAFQRGAGGGNLHKVSGQESDE